MNFLFNANEENLPVIKTARNLKAINQAVKEGFKILLKNAETSPRFPQTVWLYRHFDTGLYKHGPTPDPRYPDFSTEWEVVESFGAYKQQFKHPYAAYLIPPDLEAGTRVWVDDLIEDFLGMVTFECEYRLNSTTALWNGTDLEIEYDPKKCVAFVVG